MDISLNYGRKFLIRLHYIYTLTKSTTLNFIKHKKVELAYQEKIIEKSLIDELFQSEDTLNPYLL